jgi:hypothetical protein
MATSSAARSAEDVLRDIASERDRLADAVESLRTEATDLQAKLHAALPALAAAAAGTGFVLAGGIGATMRLLARRGREGRTLARLGSFSVVDRS